MSEEYKSELTRVGNEPRVGVEGEDFAGLVVLLRRAYVTGCGGGNEEKRRE